MIELALLQDLELSFASTSEEGRGEFKERYRSSNETVGRIAWRMVRLKQKVVESVMEFSSKLSDAKPRSEIELQSPAPMSVWQQ